MLLIHILNEAVQLSNQQKHSFNNIFRQIQEKVKNETNISISPQWLAGFLNQYNDFAGLDQRLERFQDRASDATGGDDPNKREAGYGTKMANDTRARIIARDILGEHGLVDPKNRFLPKRRGILSQMRNYYTTDIHASNMHNDIVKSTREANSDEYEEWFNALDEQKKKFVTNMQELDPKEMAMFKGIVNAKENKQEFVLRLAHWARRDDVGHSTMQRMGLINGEGKLSGPEIESLRDFLGSVSDARLKDIVSKAQTYSSKSIAHAERRAGNEVLKQTEENPTGKYNLAMKLYNLIGGKIAGMKDPERSFRRALQQITIAHDSNGGLSDVGKAALTLYHEYKGQRVDPKIALARLQSHSKGYGDGQAGPEKRAEKAGGRGRQMRSDLDL